MGQRLIDANALKVSYCKQCLKETRNEQIEVKQTPYCAIACPDFDVIDKQPTVDAVPVVRCRDCKHYKNGFCYNPNTYDDEKTCGNTSSDWFCADGERSERCD